MKVSFGKSWIVLFALAMLSLTSCKKEGTVAVVDEPDPIESNNGTVISSGAFQSNVHPTSGMAKYSTTPDGKRYLVFENFRTDNGPDLRVYLSRGPGISGAQEVGRLRAVSGNFSYELNSNFDPVQYNYVVIWCVPFSVLFGHAVLR